MDVIGPAAHIEQVSVHPNHAHQGIGRALIEKAASWAIAHGHHELTLTTYVDVPWNGPYVVSSSSAQRLEGADGPAIEAEEVGNV